MIACSTRSRSRGMMSNLRKAADRLENLIAAMLDVSQIDVNAMDLRFARSLSNTRCAWRSSR